MEVTTTSEDTVLREAGDEPVDIIASQPKESSSDNVRQRRQISVQSGNLIIETGPDAIVIHRGLDGSESGDILSALGNHIANDLAGRRLSSLEVEPRGGDDDIPDTGNGPNNHEPEEDSKLEEVETQPLVVEDAQGANASITGSSDDLRDRRGQVVALTRSSMRHISVQACSVIVGILAMLLPSFWLSILISYVSSWAFNQNSSVEFSNLNE